MIVKRIMLPIVILYVLQKEVSVTVGGGGQYPTSFLFHRQFSISSFSISPFHAVSLNVIART